MIWKVVLLTLLPFLELRYSIPAGILSGSVKLPFGLVITGYGLDPMSVFIVAVITNIILGIVLFFVVDKIVHLFLRVRFFARWYHRVLERAQKRVRKYVDKYGVIGLALFIGVPLPGSGVYTGALGAYALGFKFKQFFWSCVLGVLIAGTAVLLITLGIVNGLA